jgi:hypothetical protein
LTQQWLHEQVVSNVGALLARRRLIESPTDWMLSDDQHQVTAWAAKAMHHSPTAKLRQRLNCPLEMLSCSLFFVVTLEPGCKTNNELRIISHNLVAKAKHYLPCKELMIVQDVTALCVHFAKF